MLTGLYSSHLSCGSQGTWKVHSLSVCLSPLIIKAFFSLPFSWQKIKLRTSKRGPPIPGSSCTLPPGLRVCGSPASNVIAFGDDWVLSGPSAWRLLGLGRIWVFCVPGHNSFLYHQNLQARVPGPLMTAYPCSPGQYSFVTDNRGTHQCPQNRTLPRPGIITCIRPVVLLTWGWQNESSTFPKTQTPLS